jgi:hypothetical protein
VPEILSLDGIKCFRYCADLESLLSPVMFVQLLTAGAAICVTSFQVAEVS